MTSKRYKKNCAGDFFVEDGECTLCTLPVSEAPDLMESDEHSCYFKRQPETPEEVSQAIEAITVSCCEAVRYCGNDRHILRLIREEEIKIQNFSPEKNQHNAERSEQENSSLFDRIGRLLRRK